MAWNPGLYEKFKKEREEPFLDLVALGAWREGLSIVDLGCGTGELTARLLDSSPGARILGVDSSEEMLARARKLERPGLRFEKGDIATWRPSGKVDAIFSHAALHWLDDHRSLFARLAGFLEDGGQLLVQVPSNEGHVSHRISRELAEESPWKERLQGFVRRSPVLSIAEYAELLHGLGLSRPVVLEKVYGHVLPDSDAVLEWLRGTLLLPYLERLKDEEGKAFLAELGRRYSRAIPERPCYFGYRRTLIAARRPLTAPSA